MINIDALNDDEKLAALESIHKSIAESKEIQRKKITTNVEMIVKALKKIEADLKQRYDETGNLIANLKSGEDGKDGRDGKDGKDGRPGKDGAIGPRGYDGLPGRNGLDGKDGVSITDAHIDFDGSLIISLSTGRVINVGEVVTADIAEKIKVITNGGGTSQYVLDTLASLQAQISGITSGLDYQGTWNANTNTPTLTSSVGTNGYYYIVATAGSTNLNGVTDWQVGDWAVFNGTVWQKLDQTDIVTSVAGRTGAIVLTTADIGGLGTIATQAANNVTITGGSITGITDLAIADGGTGASTAPNARTNLGATTVGANVFTLTNPSAITFPRFNADNTVSALDAATFRTAIGAGAGTVTSVAATLPTFLSVTGSPITSSGTLAITLSGTALPTSSGGTGLTSFTADGVTFASSTSALSTSTSLTFQSTNSALTISSGTTGNGYLGFSNSADGGVQGYLGDANALITPGINSALAVRGETAILFGIASSENMRLDATGLGIGKSAGSKLDVKGTLRLSGSTSGYVGLAPAAAAGSTTYTLPSADGTNGQALVTNGSGTLSWASGSSGTVTSVGGTGTVSGISLSGTVTSSGNLTLGGTLDLSAYNAAGAFTTLAASGAVTLSGGTANGVAYLNGSKVVTSGSALTFNGDKLAVSGAGIAGADDRIFTVTNTAANSYGAMTLVGTSRGGYLNFYNGATAQAAIVGQASALSFYVGTDSSGSQSMILNSTGLGIGTSSPAYKLHVSNYMGLGTQASSGAGAGINMIPSSTLTNWFVGVNYVNPAAFEIIPSTAGGGSTFTTPAFLINSSGNVGIGTNSPAAKLEVNGQSRLGGVLQITGEGVPASGAGLELSGSASGTGITSFNRSLGTFLSQGFNALQYTFLTSGTEQMRLTSTGLGIGTSSPSYKLDITASTSQNGLRVRNTLSNIPTIILGATDTANVDWTIQNNAGNLVFNGGSTGGNVGIGTTSPGGLLQVGVPNTSTGSLRAYSSFVNIDAGYQSSNVSGTAAAPSLIWSGDDNTGIWHPASDTLAISTAASERARIDSSGNLLVGTTGQIDNERFSSVTTGTAAYFKTSGTSQTVTQFWNTATSGTIYQAIFRDGASATARGSIATDGSATAYNTSSDYRLKENIVDLPNALATVAQLKPRQFDWKETGNTTTGFIAHELAEVCPHAVTGEKDAVDENGNPKYQGIDTSFLVATLTAAIQELKAEFDAYKASHP